MISPFRAGNTPTPTPSPGPPRRGNPRPRWTLGPGSTFGIASFLAVGAGCLVARSAGAGTGVCVRNLAAWAIGALSLPLIARLPAAALFRAVMLVTPLALLITLFGPGQSGVHRWVVLGPLRWNAAFLLLPAATVAFAAIARTGARWIWWPALIIQAELCAQPDASQATAFAGAAIAALWTARWPGRHAVAATLFFGIAAAVAWWRPDPLSPVPEVEDILKLAGDQRVSMAALCIVSLAAVVASPLRGWNRAQTATHSPALALSVYFLFCSLAPSFGAFPVPLTGMGMSPIVGFWAGIGCLEAVVAACRRSSFDNPCGHSV